MTTVTFEAASSMIAPSRRLGSRRLYCSTRSVAALAAARFTELHTPVLSQVSDRNLQDTFYGGIDAVAGCGHPAATPRFVDSWRFPHRFIERCGKRHESTRSVVAGVSRS